MNIPYLKQLLLTSHGLLITEESLRSQLMLCLSVHPTPKHKLMSVPDQADNIGSMAEHKTECFFFFDEKTYQDESREAFAAIKSVIGDEVPVTMDYSSAELPDGCIAYHRIFGVITFDSKWYFSSRRFEQDLLAAESNPAIIAHLLHVSSGGGEAYYLDRLSETMRSLTKPVVVLIEKACGSAAYYISCHSTHIYSLTQNDLIGCIGTMTRVYNDNGWFEQNGIKRFDVKSSLSSRKNKVFDDLENGKTEEFVTRFLDPAARQFIDEVRAARKPLSKLPDDDPVMQGETYMAAESIDRGLIDGLMTMEDAISLAHRLGMDSRKANSLALSM